MVVHWSAHGCTPLRTGALPTGHIVSSALWAGGFPIRLLDERAHFRRDYVSHLHRCTGSEIGSLLGHTTSRHAATTLTAGGADQRSVEMNAAHQIGSDQSALTCRYGHSNGSGRARGADGGSLRVRIDPRRRAAEQSSCWRPPRRLLASDVIDDGGSSDRAELGSPRTFDCPSSTARFGRSFRHAVPRWRPFGKRLPRVPPSRRRRLYVCDWNRRLREP